MNLNIKNKKSLEMKNTSDNKQMSIIVDGCKVKLIFPIKPETSAVSDIKRMMMGSITKA
jgi:hypothetical protein